MLCENAAASLPRMEWEKNKRRLFSMLSAFAQQILILKIKQPSSIKLTKGDPILIYSVLINTPRIKPWLLRMHLDGYEIS